MKQAYIIHQHLINTTGIYVPNSNLTPEILNEIKSEQLDFTPYFTPLTQDNYPSDQEIDSLPIISVLI